MVNVLGKKLVSARLVSKDMNLLHIRRRVEIAKAMPDNVAENPTYLKTQHYW